MNKKHKVSDEAMKWAEEAAKDIDFNTSIKSRTYQEFRDEVMKKRNELGKFKGIVS